MPTLVQCTFVYHTCCLRDVHEAQTCHCASWWTWMFLQSTCPCCDVQCTWSIQRDVGAEGVGGTNMHKGLSRQDAYAAVEFVEAHARRLAGGLEAKVGVGHPWDPDFSNNSNRFKQTRLFLNWYVQPEGLIQLHNSRCVLKDFKIKHMQT